jgi:hypothetical protein
MKRENIFMEYKEFIELKNQNNEELESIISDVVVIFDSSALLTLYSYKKSTSLDILNVFNEKFRDRLYLPSHVKFEYDKNKETVRNKPLKKYDKLFIENEEPHYQKIVGEITKLRNQSKAVLKSVLGNFKTFKEEYHKQDKYPSISIDVLNQIEVILEKYIYDIKEINSEQTLSKVKKLLMTDVDLKKEELNEQLKNDELYEKIIKFFQIGKDYSFRKKLEIVFEGIKRYEALIPPGYKDAEKKDIDSLQAYGDLFVWKQVIEIGKELNKTCVFISDDIKEDWNDKNSKNKKEPRIELVQEFYEETKNKFFKYSLNDFVGIFLEKELKPKSTTEIIIQNIAEILKANIKELERDIYTGLRDMVLEEIEAPGDSDYYWELDEEYYDIESFDISSIVKNDEEVYCVKYIGLIKLYRSYLSYDYVGRDDDTKEELLSIANTMIYDGEISFEIIRKIRLDSENNIEEENNVEINLLTNNIKVNETHWEDNQEEEWEDDYI